MSEHITVSLFPQEVMLALFAERERQLLKWGDQSHTDLEWLAILAEEVGEVAMAVTKARVGPCLATPPDVYFKNLYAELVQVAAVCIAWLVDETRGVRERSVDDPA